MANREIRPEAQRPPRPESKQGSRPRARRFRSGYEIGVPLLLGLIVLLLAALMVIMALVLFHLIPL